MKIVLTSMFLVLVSCLSLAQSLQGTIYDTEGKAISKAQIQVLNSLQHVETNAYGFYLLNLSKGSYILHVSAPTYVSKNFSIEIANEDMVVNIQLESSYKKLDEVVVSASKSDEKNLDLGSSLSVFSAEKIKNTNTSWC